MDPVSTLATFAAVIGLGFLGYLFFERTRITDVLILIGFGVLIGPVFHVFDVEGFKAASALVGTLALIVIMFDGGLGLNIKELVTGIARSTVLAVVGFLLTVGAVAAAGHYWMGLDPLIAVLLGLIVGGTSGVIVMPIISGTSVSPQSRVILSVESALTDVLCVVGAVALITILAGANGSAIGAGELSLAAKGVAAQFSIAIVLGLAAGFFWLRTLKVLQERKYSYMITLAAILFLYAGAQAVGGSGAIAVLIFGVVLGNGFIIARKFDFEGLEFSDRQRQFQGEITFLIRVFFFVYLGVILDPALFANVNVFVDGTVLLFAILAARVVAVLVATWRDPETAPDRTLITLLLPRGLAAAVLAGLPLQAGLAGTESFIALAFLVIVATNMVGTAAVVSYEVKKKRLWERMIPIDVKAFSRIGRARGAEEAPEAPEAETPKGR